MLAKTIISLSGLNITLEQKLGFGCPLSPSFRLNETTQKEAERQGCLLNYAILRLTRLSTLQKLSLIISDRSETDSSSVGAQSLAQRRNYAQHIKELFAQSADPCQADLELSYPHVYPKNMYYGRLLNLHPVRESLSRTMATYPACCRGVRYIYYAINLLRLGYQIQYSLSKPT